MLGGIPANVWERRVREDLRSQLPGDWVVISNVHWSTASTGRWVRDGEADLVVLAPGLGMVVLEVKGSREFWVGDDGRWFRRDGNGDAIELSEPPPVQAMRNVHELVKVACEHCSWREFPGRFTHLVVYPNGMASSLPAMFDESTIVTRRHMKDLRHRIRHALERRGEEKRSIDFTAEAVDRVAGAFTNRGFRVVGVDTDRDVSEDVARVQQLTAQQSFALRGLFELPSVAIVGPAGSGKTLLALWRLRAMSEEGMRVLYVCYNRRLAEVLGRKEQDISDRIINVDRLFSRMVPGSNQAASGMDATEYFRSQLPGQVLGVAYRTPEPERLDAVIVDEGQDFSEEQILALMALLKPGSGQWVIFADWRQDLYRVGHAGETGADVVFRLHHNCRNTAKVNSATNLLIQQEVASMPGVPEGVVPVLELVDGRESMARRAFELASTLAPNGGGVVLSPYRLERSCMSTMRTWHGMSLTEDIGKLHQKGTVFFSTIRSFKGIEAEVVILVDTHVPNAGSVFSEEDLYVACTRPTGRLAILTAERAAHHWLERRSVG